MSRQIKRDHPKVTVDIGIAQLVAPLARIRAGRVETHEGDALPGFLIKHPIVFSLVRNTHITTGNGFNIRHGSYSYSCTLRIKSSVQVKARRFCHMTLTSPSICRRP